MSSMEALNLLVGLVSLVLSVIAIYFTYVTFVSPIHRFRKYLRNPEEWELFHGLEMNIYTYRHKKHPEFQIVIDWDKMAVSNFKEEWIMDYPFRDRDNNCSYYVRLEANGILLQREFFLSLDGHRYFVPVPRTMGEVEGERQYFYDSMQIALTRVIGKFDYYKDIYQFVAQQKNLTINETL